MNDINLHGAKVLMVDDTPANIDVLRKVLTPEGYKLSFANNGQRALRIAGRALPDLILLDIMMPGMDGFETCKHLKNDEITQNIPIIFITAKTDIDDLIEGFKVGAVDYITKPFRQEEVCMRVKTHLRAQILMKQREDLINTLKATEERFRLLATWSPIGIFQADSEGRTLYANRQWQTILGIDLESGTDWLDLVHEDDVDNVKNFWEMSLQTHRDFFSKFRIVTPKDELCWIEMRTTALRITGNENNGFVGTIEDITKERLDQEKILHAKEKAEFAVQAKSEFLAGMTHELRTPMNAIIGYSEMLAEEADNMQTAEDIQKITSAAKYLLNLINNVLDLSKVEANKMSLYLEEFEVLPLLKEVEDTISPLVAKNDNEFILQIAENIGKMTADQTKVRQILYNLLSNACKFTKQGKITLSVLQKVLENQEWIYFAVADTGIGLTEKQIARLFKKYAQATEVTARDYGGTGLGLVLSQQFCEMMGGDISVTSELSEGTTFTVKLPTEIRK